MNLVINKWVIAVNVSNFSGQYLRNHWTLDIGVLGYMGIVWPKEHSPEVWSVPPVTPCIHETPLFLNFFRASSDPLITFVDCVYCDSSGRWYWSWSWVSSVWLPPSCCPIEDCHYAHLASWLWLCFFILLVAPRVARVLTLSIAVLFRLPQ